MTPILQSFEKVGSLTPLFSEDSIVGAVSQKLKSTEIHHNKYQLAIDGKKIIRNLSYSHLSELLKIDDSQKRTFYEIECTKGTWSVRELKRQINSLLYERSGLPEKPEKLTKLVQQETIPAKSEDIIRNVYVFDFLGLDTKESVEEFDKC